MKCKPNCAPGGTLSKTRLASCSGGILAGSTGEYWRAAPARYWPDTRQDPRRDPLASYSGGMLGGIHWRATLAGHTPSYSGLLSGILDGIHWGCSGGTLGGNHWRATLAGCSAGSTGGLLWWDTRRDPLASYSGGTYPDQLWATQRDTRRDPLGLLWWDTRREPLASRSGGIIGRMH